MKRIVSLMLACLMLAAFLPPASAAAEDGLVQVRCGRQGFSTRVPEGYTAYPDESGGLILSAGQPDDPARLRISRRAHAFNNPALYIGTYTWQAFGDEYGDWECRYYDFGGKTFYGACLLMMDSPSEESVLWLVGVREAADTEFIACYSAESKDAVLALLDTAARYYEPDVRPESAEAKILPIQNEPDLENGSFRLRVEDGDRIEAEGWFTAALYQRDVFSAEDVHALKPGDTIRINDRVFTVSEVEPWSEDDWYSVDLSVREQDAEEDYTGFCFEQYGDGYVLYIGNDWYSSSRVASVRVSLPLPEQFRFYEVPGGDDPELYPTEYFLSEASGVTGLIYLSQYNATCRFSGGELAEVSSSGYPYGPVDPPLP